MRYNIAIVVVAFNRSKSLKRLLNSLNNVRYSNEDNVRLIISIDKSPVDEVYKIAEDYLFEHGDKELIRHNKNLGLKNHILMCGEISQQFDAVIVLEDDLIVSPNMYEYAVSCIDMYDQDEDIAGISLYTHLRNFHNDMPFTPRRNSYDVFFMQISQSWGQVWTKRMWKEFKDWYDAFSLREEKDIEGLFPKSISNWGEKSWLKYHMMFLYETNKFFVYPYNSHSTNFTEIGTHNKRTNTNYQVPLYLSDDKKYNLPKSMKDSVVYDIYFESIELKNMLEKKYPVITIDLYGIKWGDFKNELSECSDFLLSSEVLPFDVVQSYVRELRPIENNVLYDIEGEQLFIYDLNKYSTQYKINKFNLLINELYSLEYHYQITSTRLISRLLKLNLFKRIKYIFRGEK